MKLLTHDLAGMLEFGGYVQGDLDDAAMCKIGYLCDLINARVGATPGDGDSIFWNWWGRQYPQRDSWTKQEAAKAAWDAKFAHEVDDILRMKPRFEESLMTEPSLHEMILRYYSHNFSPEITAQYVQRYEADLKGDPIYGA